MPLRLFVTGTDTDVGKTIVAAALTLGLHGIYWKPIQCGTEPATDRESVRRWTELPEERFLPENYLLRAPLSPHAAAHAEGMTIDLNHILRTPLPQDRPLIVEGAGGILVPIHRQALVADLIQGLGFPVVLVARTALGTINHTLLSISELRRRSIQILGVVLNGEENEGNRVAIEDYGGVPVLGRIPLMAKVDQPSLYKAFEGLDLEKSMKVRGRN